MVGISSITLDGKGLQREPLFFLPQKPLLLVSPCCISVKPLSLRAQLPTPLDSSGRLIAIVTSNLEALLESTITTREYVSFPLLSRHQSLIAQIFFYKSSLRLLT